MLLQQSFPSLTGLSSYNTKQQKTQVNLGFRSTLKALGFADIASKTIVRAIPLAGQPDSVAVSPAGDYAAIVIENERDEDLGDGASASKARPAAKPS